jgi:hypothetical protein
MIGIDRVSDNFLCGVEQLTHTKTDVTLPLPEGTDPLGKPRVTGTFGRLPFLIFRPWANF